MPQTAEDILEHFGVKGMKWGVRRELHTGKIKVGSKDDLAVSQLVRGERTQTAKSLAGGQPKFDRAFVYKLAKKQVDKELNSLNNSPKYKGKDVRKNKQYYEDARKAIERGFIKAHKRDRALYYGGIAVTISAKTAAVLMGAPIIPSVAHAATDSTQQRLDLVLVLDDLGHITSIALSDEVGHSDQVDDVLEHFGVKGMKWGVRKSRSTGGSGGPEPITTKSSPGERVRAIGGSRRMPSEDAKRAAALKVKAKKSTTDSLTNKEMQELITRMQLEAQYKKLNPVQKSLARRFIEQQLKAVAQDELKKLAAGDKTRMNQLKAAMNATKKTRR